MKNSLIAVIILIYLVSCEEVIEVDLNSSDPAFVVEAMIYKDSVSHVILTKTTSYFSVEESEFIEDAVIKVSDGTSTEELSYKSNGNYFGNTIIGTAGRTYELEILHDGILYEAISYMPLKADIISVHYGKSEQQSPLNPTGKTVFTIQCQFNDNPDIDNYYMIRYITSNGKLLERYYLLTEDNANSGNINTAENDIISFSESIFYDGGEVDVQLYSIDKSVYDYFLQLSDVLFWKRRVMPPTPYNPKSNISNGALGYFAAWAYDSEKIILE